MNDVHSSDFKDYLTEDELTLVTSRSDLRAAMIVLFDWVVIIGLLLMAGLYPNPLVYLLVIILLGGRQMAFGVLVHETGHKTFFTSSWTNEFVGTWLSGYWVFSDKDAYMKGHLVHHREAGTSDDPDLKNYRDYPVPESRFRRKIMRDLTGQLGWRRLRSIYRSLRRLNQLPTHVRRTMVRSVACNLGLLAVCSAFGQPWLYLLWLIAFMTSHMLIARIRQISEHAAVPDLYDLDPRKNTRTLYISPLESLLIAPHDLNYHLEHHLMPSVPIYRLRTLHNLLLSRGFYKGMNFSRGYLKLLRQVTYAG